MLIAAPAVGVEVLKPYQKDRLTAFLSPGENQGKEAYQINQSLTAIGSGGKTGRGDEATQTKLDFLPEHHTDFVFSVVGEEFGFVGAALVLSLFALLIWRALAYPYDCEELLRSTCRRGHHRDADVPGLRKRGHDDRNHAHHRHPLAARQLRRLVGNHNIDRNRPTAVDPRAGARNGCGQAPMSFMKGNLLEKAVARLGGPRRNQSRDPGIGGHPLRR